jgi:DnaD/phage-associated family protein
MFFSELLPLIDNMCELKVTLHMFWLVGLRRDVLSPGARLDTLLGDDVLLRSLESPDRSGAAALQEGLERAVARGTLLHLALERDGDLQHWYFFNSEHGRKALARLEAGDWSALPELRPAAQSRLRIERPNVFILYEQNIGPLTPLIVEELREAEQCYTASWIEEAIRVAVEQNVRRWRYVRAILERWSSEGKDDGAPGRSDEENRYRYIRGDYADYIEH